MKQLICLCMLLAFHLVSAQDTFPENGVADERPRVYAFTNATIFVDYKTRLENATLVIKDGLVLGAGSNISIPNGAVVTDLNGKFIYPGIVDPYSDYGVPSAQRSSRSNKPQYDSKQKGAFGWNDAIKSTYDAVTDFIPSSSDASVLRKAGITSVNTFRADGIVRGTSLFTNLSDLSPQEAVVQPQSAFHYSFMKGSSQQEYPSSIMGVVALLRQTYYDSEWYKDQGSNIQTNLTLDAFNAKQNLPQVFEANSDKLRVLLADKIANEFGVNYIIKGNGDEYQRAAELKQAAASLIIPVVYPDAYDVDDPLSTMDISLNDMKHWELAPSNASILSEHGIEFAFTSSGLKNASDYWINVRKAVKAGLSEDEALKALTFTPAKYYNVQSKVGAIRKGMLANFFIASASMFENDAVIHQTWVQGEKNAFKDLDEEDYEGQYEFTVGNKTYLVEVSGKAGANKAQLVIDSAKVDMKFKVEDKRVTLVYQLDGDDSATRLSGWINENGFAGNGQSAKGEWVEWTAKRTGNLDESDGDEKIEEEEDVDVIESELGKIVYPFLAYGWEKKPEQETILFQNATVWTLEGEGKIEEADVLVKDGEIALVGTGLKVSGARVVDATGKHITPGIIDEHSHIALSSVNEGSHSITAEVRMYDAVDSEDIDIYRQLAGGVTVAQLLHGSANPVGGQSALVKFRWGSNPTQMAIKGADGYIKFALGENVKQSNWGDDYNVRFPQTRMGVEQVYVDGFTRAKEYGEAKAKYAGLNRKAKASAKAPRTDLQLETLLEIINKERFITCHSYVQSEINMLMKVAEDFDFRINTFTHILEGYKVADKMAEHGVGGSTFSDWWAYKFEVKDAIPYNASLMTMAGVISAINSDDAEMARRLNQEAAKSVKYGGMSEVEALKMVTLNPAILLHLEDRMGSIKVGKDADLVLWNDHPLSIYAKPEMTLVDGIVYFSLEEDKRMRGEVAAERARLISKMRDAKGGGAKTQKPKKKEKHRFECEDLVNEVATLNQEQND